MTLLLIPMTQSVAFRKLGVGPGCGDDKKKLSHGDQIREACAEKLKTSGLSAVADNSRKRKDLDLEPEATLEHASQKSRRMEAMEGGIGISEPATAAATRNTAEQQEEPEGCLCWILGRREQVQDNSGISVRPYRTQGENSA